MPHCSERQAGRPLGTPPVVSRLCRSCRTYYAHEFPTSAACSRAGTRQCAKMGIIQRAKPFKVFSRVIPLLDFMLQLCCAAQMPFSEKTGVFFGSQPAGKSAPSGLLSCSCWTVQRFFPCVPPYLVNVCASQRLFVFLQPFSAPAPGLFGGTSQSVVVIF